MKKVILAIITILFIINFNNVYAKGYCTYEYDGAVLTVYEEENNDISYNVNNDNISSETNFNGQMLPIFMVAIEKDSIRKDLFYLSGSFSCPTINIYKTYAPSDNKVLVEFSQNTSRSNPTDTVNATLSGNKDKYCDLTYTDNKQINVKVRVTENNGKLQFENIIHKNISLGTEIGPTLHSGLLKDYFLDSSGHLNCDIARSFNLKMLIGKDEKGSIANGYGGYLYGSKMTEEEAKDGMFLQIGYQYKDYYSVDVQVNANDSGNDDIDIGMSQGDMDCDGILAGRTGEFLKNTLNFIKFLVPIIIIGFTIIDFIKAIASQDDKEIKKASDKLIKRVIIGIVIFLLPSLLEYALKIADIPYGTCTLK